MNRRAFAWAMVPIFALVTIAVRPAAAQQAGAQRPATATAAEQEVRKADSDRFAAMLKNDLPALDKLLAPDLIYTHGDGRVVDKAAFIADLKTGDFKYVSIDAQDVKVRVYGDMAIVNAVAGMQVVNKGAPAKIRIVYTNVHVRLGGSWQMVAWHATRLAQ